MKFVIVSRKGILCAVKLTFGSVFSNYIFLVSRKINREVKKERKIYNEKTDKNFSFDLLFVFGYIAFLGGIF